MKKYIIFYILFFICFGLKAQWSTQIQGNGNATVSTNTAFILGADGVGGGLINGISTTVSKDTTISFDWSYITYDIDASYDPFFYSINGIRSDIKNFGSSGNGSLFKSLNTGDVFFLGIDNTDGCCGGSKVTLTFLATSVWEGLTRNGNKTKDPCIQVNINGKIGSGKTVNGSGKQLMDPDK